MSGIQLRATLLEKAPKFRIKISVPNSARVIRTSWIVIDEQQAVALQASQNDKGFAEFPIDVTVLCEYKHDIRANHQSNLEFDLEVVPSGSRAKNIGSGSVDLALVVQSPMKIPMKLRKDAATTGFIKIEVHSLCIAKTSPITRDVAPRAMSSCQTSDSETEFSVTPLTDDLIEKIRKAMSKGHFVAVDGSTRNGTVLMNAAFGHDYVMSIPDLHVAQYIFDVAAGSPNDYTQCIFRFVVAGDMYFFASILTQFIAVRDKGLLPTDAFVFMFMPLFAQTDRYREEFGIHPPFCQIPTVFDSSWLSIFDEQSSEQNVPAAVSEKFEYTLTAPISITNVQIMDVMITTIADQIIVPMIIDLQIGEYIRTSQKEMKATFFTDSSKTVSMKFHHLSISRVGTQIVTSWRKMSNVNDLGIQSVEKYTSEKKSREASKVILSIKKGQAPVRIKVDNKEYRGVISITVTMRDPKIALRTAVPKAQKMMLSDM